MYKMYYRGDCTTNVQDVLKGGLHYKCTGCSIGGTALQMYKMYYRGDCTTNVQDVL